MYCPNCGEQLPEGARFCGACGSMLVESVNMDAQEPASTEELTASGYEEGPNTAGRIATPESAEEFPPMDMTVVPEHEGESVSTEGAKAPEVEEMPVGSAEEPRNPDASESQAEQSAVQKPRKNNALPVLLIAGIVIIIIAVNVIIAMMPTEEERWQEQYDLGQQYLLELDYEQAIVAFTAAIEIDGNNAQAYVARAEVYLAADAASAEGSLETEAAEDVILSDYQAAALEDYLTAIGLDDTLEDAYIGAAGLYVAAGEDDLAMELLSSYPVGDDDLPEQIAAMLEELSNQTGKKSLCIKYSGEGYYYLYEYDAYGNCLLENLYLDDALSSYYAYFYDESGNQVLRIYYDLDGTLNEWCVFLYDSQGNRTALTAYYADGTIYAHSEYEYNSDGNLTAVLGYNESGTYRSVYTDGNLTASYSYDESGNLESYTIYETDDAGNRSGYTSYYADGTAWRWVEFEYVYDEEGYCLRSVMKDSYEYSTGDFSYSYVGEYTVVEVLPWDEDAAEAGREAGYVLTEEEITDVINGEWLPGTAS